MFKKVLAVILSLTLMLGIFTGMELSVFAAEDTVTEERNVHYSDLFYGYTYYLEESPILRQYYESTSDTFVEIYTDFYNDGEYSWSQAKTYVDLLGSPSQMVAIIAEQMGFGHYTYENMLDNANVIFAKHLVGGYEGSEFAPTFNKYYTAYKDATQLIGDISHEMLNIPKDSDTYATDVIDTILNAFKADGLLDKIPDTELIKTSEKIVSCMGEIVSIAGEITTVIDAANVYATSLALENARIDVVYDIYTGALSNTMLKDGMSRLYAELRTDFSMYFIENYIEDKLLFDLADELLGNIGGGAVSVVSGVAKVLSFVSFEIIRPQTVSLDDLLTQVALRAYIDDMYDAVIIQATVFLEPFDSIEAIKYMNLLQGLVCAVDAATDATEKIVLDYNAAQLEAIKRNFYKQDIVAAILNQAVETIKTTPKEELVKYSYGDWQISEYASSYNLTLSGGSDEIALHTIYTPWDGLAANIKVTTDYYLTVPEGTHAYLNGGINCIKGRNRGGAFIYNYGKLTADGGILLYSDRAYATAGIHNYGILKTNDNLVFGYNGVLINYSGSELHVKKNISATPSIANDSTVYLGGDWNNSTSVGTLVLTGDAAQSIGNITAKRLLIDNSSEAGITLNKVNVNELFNHNGKTFTATNCTFVDYDGDGIKDNVDAEPMVGNPCTITVVSGDERQGTVSNSVIETLGGAEHTVTATPTEKYEFVEWVNSAGASVAKTAEYSFVAKADDTLTAVFQKRSQPITVEVSGGSIYAPSKAEIESTVNVSFSEDEGYVYTEGSLSFNGNTIENESFIMPDEPVTLTAEFVRNENYFALKEKINEAKAYTFDNYSSASFADLQMAIMYAESVLYNDVTAETANEHIVALQNAESALTDKFIVEIAATYIPELYIGVEDLIYGSTVTIYYDNGTTETTAAYTIDGFDCNTLGEQTVVFNYGIARAETAVTVVKREISHSVFDSIPDQVLVNENTCFEPALNGTYPLTGDALVLGEDYTVSYSNNNTVGTATATVTGIGSYTGDTDIAFTICCDHSEGYSDTGFCKECDGFKAPVTNEEGTYLIYNAGELFGFAEMVNSGNNAINGKLMCDLDVSEYEFVKIGTVSYPYSGTFDGGSHTLNFIINDTQYAAPFGTVANCTIKNLNATGTINASDKYAGGIIGEVLESYTAKIQNCLSGVAINSTVMGDGTHGGLVGVAYNTVINNCGFYGSINGSSTSRCAGLVGWSKNSCTVSNSYVAATFTLNLYENNTFVRNNHSLTNCYYLNKLNSVSSGASQKTAEQFANGEVRDLLNNGDIQWIQTVGVDLYPQLCAHKQFKNGVCIDCGGFEDITQNANGYYEIGNAGQLFKFANMVNSGNNYICALLTADIDLAGYLWTPIGIHDDFDYTVRDVHFSGTFDGGYHVIRNMRVEISSTIEAGFFGRTEYATIQNVGFENAYVAQTNENCIRAGIIGGEIYGSKVINCYSQGTVTTLNDSGGIAGEAAGGTTITNCFTTYAAVKGNSMGTASGCYDSTNTAPADFANGLLRSALNSNGEDIWAQNVGLDAWPRFASAKTVRGDINADSIIDSVDLAALRKSLLTAELSCSGDTNCDSITDIRDLVRLKKYLAGELEIKDESTDNESIEG